MPMGQIKKIIKQPSTAGEKTKENLDEKIRRIRQENKERERRFKEIEQDKKLALDQERINESPKLNVQLNINNNQQMTMKGIRPTTTKKIAKGRGETLRQLSNYPLKAETFKSRTKEHNASFEEYLPGKVKLMNNCRSSIRERIKTKNKNCEAIVHVVENTQESDGSQTTPQASIDTIKSDDIKEETKPESHKEGNVSPCEKNEQNSTETDKVLDNMPQETSANSNSQLAEEPSSPQKNTKPKIRVSLKKTASSSSLDASIAMLSPLDVPQNWGDIDFSDDELPSVLTWQNP